ncbi:DUF6544 family protein [Miltoncostaea oceani]|uniref:DUF6544 family protein n=1 Tax=Miltoncostaea oceani TaxID=2843216 RepID=UPI001C3D217A|nr:DUF6544 family protein [Miltoncostaea oceani]
MCAIHVAPAAPATPRPPPRDLPARVQLDWDALGAVTHPPPPTTERDDLPPAARRWLDHVLPPGAEGLRHAELWTHGEIRIGRWRPFRARQVIVPDRGYVWWARAGRGPLAVRGFDRLIDGVGEMRWRLAGLVPVMSATGPDVTRSAAGRLAAEMVLCPPGALAPSVRWWGCDDDDHAVAEAAILGHPHRMTIAVTRGGRMTGLDLERWGDPDGAGAALHTFAVRFAGEVRTGGVAVPAVMRAGWVTADGRDLGESFRATIDGIVLR